MPATTSPRPLPFKPDRYSPEYASLLGVAEGLPAAAVSSLESLHSYLDAYPTASDWEPAYYSPRFEKGPVPHWPFTDFGKAVRLEWTIKGNVLRGWKARLEELAPQYLYRDVRWIRPGIGQDRDIPPTPLMTWWALLFGLSMMARYNPAQWTQALNVDESPIAANLESLLEDALADVPQLVLNELRGEPHLRLRP